MVSDPDANHRGNHLSYANLDPRLPLVGAPTVYEARSNGVLNVHHLTRFAGEGQSAMPHYFL